MTGNARIRWLGTLAFCAATGTLPALAADIAGDIVVPPTASNSRPAGSADATVPAPRSYGSVEAINGGVDADQAAAIKRLAPQYKLRIELSGRGGEYQVADRLKLLRGGQGGDVIAEIPQAGPWLLLDVPPGRYTLQGQFAERTLQRDVTVAAGGTTVHWVLPDTVN
jgi:hypothetical protein